MFYSFRFFIRCVMFLQGGIRVTLSKQNDFNPENHTPNKINHLSIQFANLFSDDNSTAQFETQSDTLSLPDLTAIENACPRDEFFHTFSPQHMVAVGRLKAIFEASTSTENFLQIAKALRNRKEIHPKVWYHAITSYVYQHPTFQSMHKISPFEAMPDLFINSDTIEKARNLGRKLAADANGTNNARQICVSLDENVGADNGFENNLWYIREDVMLNAHHWTFHLIYPLTDNRTREDRRGELFYYYHRSLLARYNVERMSFGLPPSSPFELVEGGMIREGYIPHLKDELTGNPWAPRRPFETVNDVVHVGKPELAAYDVLVKEMITEPAARILQGIECGFLIDSTGRQISLQSKDGIDILGDVIQGSKYNINMKLYSGIGDHGLHNNGHRLLGRASDPTFSLGLAPGVMLDSGTAMRDPIFFRWHTTMANLFEKHKQSLPPYTPTGGELPLIWPKVEIKHIFVQSDDKNAGRNKLRTFWNRTKFRLSRGLDFFQPHGSEAVDICAKHLDHDEFTYHFMIERDYAGEPSIGTIRIFLAPRYNEYGDRFSIQDQRMYFFALDTFSVQLHAGPNHIARHSSHSTLTIPFSQSLYDVESSTHINTLSKTPFCGCGFPHHLLLPRGKPKGLTFDLFVMVTNGDEDYVLGSRQAFGPGTKAEGCQAAYLNCGIVNQKYPDAKPMGYPFDRVPYSVSKSGDEYNVEIVQNLEEYVRYVPNMETTKVTITHDGNTNAAELEKFIVE